MIHQPQKDGEKHIRIFVSNWIPRLHDTILTSYLPMGFLDEPVAYHPKHKPMGPIFNMAFLWEMYGHVMPEDLFHTTYF